MGRPLPTTASAMPALLLINPGLLLLVPFLMVWVRPPLGPRSPTVGSQWRHQPPSLSHLGCIVPPPSLTPPTPLSAPVLMALVSSTTRRLFHQAQKGQLVHFRRFTPRMVVASSHRSLSMFTQDTSLTRDFEPKSTAPLHISLRMQSSVPLSVRA